MANWQFYRHMPVYLRNGRLLGRVQEIGHAVDFLHVQQGRMLVRDWYVPTTAIDSVTSEGVSLKTSLGEMRSHGWRVPPEPFLARQGATPGYEYTSPDDIPAYGDTAVAGRERKG